MVGPIATLGFFLAPVLGESPHPGESAVGLAGLEGQIGVVANPSPEVLSTSVLILSVACLMAGFWMIRFSFAKGD